MTPDKLTTLRKQSKATQAECAAVLCVPTRRFQRWEAGKPCIPYSDFTLLCIFLYAKTRITRDQVSDLMCPGELICPITFDMLFVKNLADT